MSVEPPPRLARRPTWGLALSAAVTVLGGHAQAAAPRVVEAQVQAVGPHSYRLTWSASGPKVPVDVYMADRADAGADRRLVVDDDADGQATVTAASSRPYFYVAADRGRGVWAAERVLPLEGGRNFRDLGGYRTRDGRRVRWGRVYRSGSMAQLTNADYRYLARLGVRVVCDFRATPEREAEPNRWVQDEKVAYWTRDYLMSAGDLGRLMASEATTPAETRAAMLTLYRELPFEQASAYREMFDRLARGEIPLAFNCSAGKDRAGVAAALLLTLLGVPREAVIADYALSDKVVDYRRVFGRPSAHAPAAIGRLSMEAADPLLRSDPAYLAAAFVAIERRRGSVARYLRTDLGVTPREAAAIRRQLLD